MNNELLRRIYLLEEPELPEDIDDLPNQECPGSICFECGQLDCICWPDEENNEEPEEPIEEEDHD